MATFFVAAFVVAAIINYLIVLSNLKSCTENKEHRIWAKAVRLILTIGATLSVLTYSFVAYYLWILPTFHTWLSFEGLSHALVFGYLWLNLSFNYFAAIMTSPGKAYSIAQLENEGYATENVSICKKCKRFKSFGTGHCSSCGYCVRLVSHHSYLMNTCVGLNNYSYYYLLLCYACLAQGFGIYELFRPFTICVLHRGNDGAAAMRHCSDMGDIAVLFFLISFSLLLTLSSLLVQTILLRVDKSQKEFINEIKSSSSCRHMIRILLSTCRRRAHRHRLQHLISERKPDWKDILVPSLHEPPIDLAAEDYIDYETEADHMI